MDASTVLIGAEGFEFPVVIDQIPEERAVDIFAPDGPDQSFDEGVDAGVYDTDLISSTLRIRRLASHP